MTPTTTKERNMAIAVLAAGIRALASGRLVDVDEAGRATFLTCNWLIEVPSGNPEPDSYADTVRIIECGAALYFDAPDGHVCEAGHEFGNMERHLGPGGTEWEREQNERRDYAGV